MKIVIGPMVRRLSVQYYARFEKWPQTLKLILRGAPIPPALINEGVIARAKELSGVVEEEPTTQATVTPLRERMRWVPDLSRTCGGCGQKTVEDGKCKLCGKVKL